MHIRLVRMDEITRILSSITKISAQRNDPVARLQTSYLLQETVDILGAKVFMLTASSSHRGRSVQRSYFMKGRAHRSP